MSATLHRIGTEALLVILGLVAGWWLRDCAERFGLYDGDDDYERERRFGPRGDNCGPIRGAR